MVEDLGEGHDVELFVLKWKVGYGGLDVSEGEGVGQGMRSNVDQRDVERGCSDTDCPVHVARNIQEFPARRCIPQPLGYVCKPGQLAQLPVRDGKRQIRRFFYAWLVGPPGIFESRIEVTFELFEDLLDAPGASPLLINLRIKVASGVKFLL